MLASSPRAAAVQWCLVAILWAAHVAIVRAAVCVDYRARGWYTQPTTFHSGVPSTNSIVNLPAALSVCELEQLQKDCVNRINEYRAGTRVFTGGTTDPNMPVAAMIHEQGNNACSSAQAVGDLIVNNGGSSCAGAHANAFSCPWSSNVGQNSCCRRSGSTYSAIQSQLYGCLQQMWDEGIGQPANPSFTSANGHWMNMRSSTLRYVSCGFAFNSLGQVWMNQDFSAGLPASVPATCTCTTAGASDGCGGTCVDSGSSTGGTTGGSTGGSTTGGSGSSSSSSEGLSEGAAAGVAIGVILGVCLAAVIVIVIVRKRKQDQQPGAGSGKSVKQTVSTMNMTSVNSTTSVTRPPSASPSAGSFWASGGASNASPQPTGSPHSAVPIYQPEGAATSPSFGRAAVSPRALSPATTSPRPQPSAPPAVASVSPRPFGQGAAPATNSVSPRGGAQPTAPPRKLPVPPPFASPARPAAVSPRSPALPARPQSPTVKPVSSPWAAYQDPQGHTYYFNASTNQSQWDKPPGFF